MEYDHLDLKIRELKSLAKEIEKQSDNGNLFLYEKSLQQVLIATTSLFHSLNILAKAHHNEELQTLFRSYLQIISELNAVIGGDIENAPNPATMLTRITDTFKHFIDGCIAKKTQGKILRYGQYVPYIGSLINYYYTIPKYWPYTNRPDKVAIMLSTIFDITAVALTIAAIATPLLAVVPPLAGVIVLANTLVLKLYDVALKHAKAEHELTKTIADVRKELTSQERFMKSEVNKLFPKHGKPKPVKWSDTEKQPEKEKKITIEDLLNAFASDPAKKIIPSTW